MAFAIYVVLSMCLSVFALSDKRLCADSKCQVPISLAEVKIPYVAIEKEKINLKRDQIVTVFSKEAGKDKSLWEVQVEGKRGYAPKSFLKETKTFHKVLNYEVPTESEFSSSKTGPDSNTPEENASSVPSISNSFDVVDGTTIYANPTGDVLETQPIETHSFNTQQSDNIQSSKTIDATSISKNKLDEPDSSLILPQPTTSSPLYSASISDNQRDTKTQNFYEEHLKKSGLGMTETENSERENDNKDTKESDLSSINEYVKVGNTEESKTLVKEDASTETFDNYDEIEDDEEIEDEEGAEEVDEDEDEDEKGIESGVGEEEKEVDDEENAAHEVRDSDNEASTIGVHHEQPDSSESAFANSSTERTGSLEENLVVANIHKEPESNTHKEENTSISENNDKLYKVTTSEIVSALDTHGSAQKSSASEGQTEATDNIDTTGDNNSGMKDSDKNVVLDESNELLSTSDMLRGDIAETFKESSSLFAENANTVNSEDLQGEKITEDKREKKFNLPSSFGKWSEIVQGDSQQKIKDDKIHEDTSEDRRFSQNLDAADVSTEEASTDNSFANELDYTTEKYLHMSTQDNAVEQSDNQKDMELPPIDPQNKYHSAEDDASDSSSIIVQTNADENSAEVQGTCDMPSSECEQESDDLPEQVSSVMEEERGWFALLTERASLNSDLLMDREIQKNSFVTLLYLMVTAITVLVFSLGYYYIEKQRRDGSLLAKINKLERELMVSSQEKFELKDELESLSVLKTSSDSGKLSSVLNDELEEYKKARAELEEQVASLEKELEAATEAGLELNRMMSELLSAQQGSDTLMKSVEHLQKQLDSQQSTISTMNACLTAKNLENENLQSELNIASERVQNLEEQLSKVNESLMDVQKEKSEIEDDFQMKNQSIECQLVEALESKSADSQRLCRELDALQDVLIETRKTLAAREGEVSVLRECLSHAECLSSGGESNVSLEALLDVGHLRAKIDTVTRERDELQEKLQGEEDARKLLEDHMKIVSEEVSTLRTKYEEADRGKMEAQTRLDVLSNYFKEKETQLQKELGLQEAMYIQKEGDALSTIEQIKAFQEETENYKAQNEILQKEIFDQERSMKSQLAMLEKKAHENWVSARQAERRLEESKQESSQLRNRLTLSGRRIVGTIPGPDVGKPPERGTLDLERNGEMSSSPAHMGETQELPSSPLHFGLPASPPLLPPGGQPLPPGPFPSMPLGVFLPPGAPGMPFPMPPPPGGLFPDDLRPPPLGRMSSPPPEPHGSFSPFDHSPPMSPHNRPYRSPLHYEDSSNRYRRQTPPSSGIPSFNSPFPPGKWDDRSEPPRSSFRPLHRDSPREPKGSTLSSGHSSESLDKGSRHSRV